MKNTLIAVGSVLGFVLVVLLFSRASATPPISADLAATAERVVTEMQQTGLIGRIDDAAATSTCSRRAGPRSPSTISAPWRRRARSTSGSAGRRATPISTTT